MLRLSKVAAGRYHACGLDLEGQAWCWGDNQWGQLGVESFVGQPAPTPVATSSALLQIAVSHPLGPHGAHTCAITEASRALCWGDGTEGQLGVGAVTGLELCDGERHRCASSPRSVSSPALSAIVTGTGATCGRGSGSALWCWGSGVHAPEHEGDGPSLRLSSIAQHRCGVDDGQVGVCWGFSPSGALGTGTLQELRPTEVQGDRDWLVISAGVHHTCGLTTDGAAWCWGEAGPSLGLGEPPVDDVSSPQPVDSTLEFESISASTHTCGISTAGALWCWGPNQRGQLGDGTTRERARPVRVLDTVAYDGPPHAPGERP